MPLRIKITSKEKWINFEQIVPDDFLKTRFSLILVAPNGSGKTTSIIRFLSKIRFVTQIERIYITFVTHEQSKKYLELLSKLESFPIVYYEGIERVCRNKKLLEEVKKLGLPLNFACNVCPYNILRFYNAKKLEDRHKVVAEIVKEWINKGIKIISVTNTSTWSWKIMDYVCTQPVIRHLVEFVQVDTYLKKKLIMIVPIHIFKTKSIVYNWRQYAKRQRKRRLILIFFDEADDIFYKGFEYKFAKPNFTQFDKDILNRLSTVSYNFSKLVQIYEEIYNTLKKYYIGVLDVTNALSKINYLIDSNKKLINALHSRLSKICHEAFNRKEYTFIPSAIESLLVVEKIARNVLRTIDFDSNDFILYDYDYAYQVLLNPDFPFRTCAKISATATLPDIEVMLESFLIREGKKVLLNTIKIDVYPENTWISHFALFSERPSRNKEIKFRFVKLLQYIVRAIEEYKKRTKKIPNGVIVFMGNKKQFRTAYEKLKQFAYDVKDFYFKVRVRALGTDFEVVFTYVASPISRALDLDQYDIAFVVAPLLRPPRRKAFYDIMDIAKAVSDSIQSAFRIVRSLLPSKPKLLAFEQCFLAGVRYYSTTPSWFKQLVRYCLRNGMVFELTLKTQF